MARVLNNRLKKFFSSQKNRVTEQDYSCFKHFGDITVLYKPDQFIDKNKAFDGVLTVDEIKAWLKEKNLKLIEKKVTHDSINYSLPPFIYSNPEKSFIVLEKKADQIKILLSSGKEKACSIAELNHDNANLYFVSKVNESKPSLWNYMTRIKGALKEIILASVICNLLTLATPLFAMTVYNKVIGQKALDTLSVLTIGILSLFVFDALLRGFRGYILSHLGTRLNVLVGSELLANILFSEKQSNNKGLILEKIRSHETIKKFITSQIPLLFVDFIFVFVFIAMLFFFNASFGYLALASVPLFIGISLLIHKKQMVLTEKSQIGSMIKSSFQNELVTNFRNIKTFALEGEMLKKWDQRSSFLSWHEFKMQSLFNINNSIGHFLQQSIGVLVIFLGARLVINAEISIGVLIASSILMNKIIGPLRSIVSGWYEIMEAKKAFVKVNHLIEKEQRNINIFSDDIDVQAEISFKKIAIQFDKEKPYLFENISFDAKPGEVVAISGDMSKGKTTLYNLLLGHLEPSKGQIIIDHKDLNFYEMHKLRKKMSYLSSDPSFFEGSIRENISYGCQDVQPHSIIALSKFAGLHEAIMSFENGYDTLYQDVEHALSKGEKQLLSVVRGLIRNPKIIIFDDALSALGTLREKLFFEKLKTVSANRVIFMTSLNKTTIELADKKITLGDKSISTKGKVKDSA